MIGTDIELKYRGWLDNDQLQLVLLILSKDGEQARVNGGAVRNAIMGEPISDVDISTTLLPEDVIERLEAKGMKVIPTGIEHGTVTVLTDGHHFEVTTLREDIATDGRHAMVEFGRDWKLDAMRRDMTMNALYCDINGKVYDPLGGYEDLMARRVIFIGDADERIREDYLRILRFFRFFAWYGTMRPDAEGLKACARLKGEIKNLSVERVWAELKKLLAAPDPSRALLWMRTAGVLTAVLPESGKWGIDRIHGLVRMEKELKWDFDPVLRMMSILPVSTEVAIGLSKRLKLSSKEAKRLLLWSQCSLPDVKISENEFSKLLYRSSPRAMKDTLKLELARIATYDKDGPMEEIKFLFAQAQKWQRPDFPVQGKDLLAQGFKEGAELGLKLAGLEEMWVESDFTMSKSDLLGE
ncbi:MAG: CCA tRNA nucleotidyltransferase [Hyphomicrobiales bacterium]|nr:MAG: CCA tRNA nucleotidyltransferase [Hyphomicrobiales bacterium]